jgi:hypothetical protein
LGIESAFGLLAAFARERGSMPPDKFVVRQLRAQLATPAAVASLPGAETRAKLVHLGEEEKGGPTRETLSRFALVFKGQPGDWTARPNPAAGMTEYIFHKGSRAEVKALGAIEINDRGEVVRILEAAVEGGEEKLKELMKQAGWKFARDVG